MCGSISTLEMSITYCTKKKINRTRRRRENRNMKSRLIFTLCSSSSFCYVFPHFQFPFKTNFSATPSFLNVFSWLLPHTPLSEKNSLPPLNPFFFPPKKWRSLANLHLLSVYPLFQVFTCSSHQPVYILNHHHGKVVVSMATRPSMLGSSRNQSPLFQNCCQLSRDCGTW